MPATIPCVGLKAFSHTRIYELLFELQHNNLSCLTHVRYFFCTFAHRSRMRGRPHAGDWLEMSRCIASCLGEGVLRAAAELYTRAHLLWLVGLVDRRVLGCSISRTELSLCL